MARHIKNTHTKGLFSRGKMTTSVNEGEEGLKDRRYQARSTASAPTSIRTCTRSSRRACSRRMFPWGAPLNDLPIPQNSGGYLVWTP